MCRLWRERDFSVGWRTIGAKLTPGESLVLPSSRSTSLGEGTIMPSGALRLLFWALPSFLLSAETEMLGSMAFVPSFRPPRSCLPELAEAVETGRKRERRNELVESFDVQDT